jgi:RNA polymerase sigma factor (sigma-70 family)
MSDVTRILSQLEQGDAGAAERLLPLVYAELRKLAAAKLAQEKPGQTLQATALVHEAYLRLIGENEVRDRRSEVGQPSPTSDRGPRTSGSFNSRGHFFGAAAEAMRRILVEQARRKHAMKRGGQQERIELTDVTANEPASAVDLLALNDALDELAGVDSRAAELVKLRYFAGLSGAEAAQALGISARTADRTWLYARTWLLKKLEDGAEP